MKSNKYYSIQWFEEDFEGKVSEYSLRFSSLNNAESLYDGLSKKHYVTWILLHECNLLKESERV